MGRGLANGTAPVDAPSGATVRAAGMGADVAERHRRRQVTLGLGEQRAGRAWLRWVKGGGWRVRHGAPATSAPVDHASRTGRAAGAAAAAPHCRTGQRSAPGRDVHRHGARRRDRRRCSRVFRLQPPWCARGRDSRCGGGGASPGRGVHEARRGPSSRSSTGGWSRCRSRRHGPPPEGRSRRAVALVQGWRRVGPHVSSLKGSRRRGQPDTPRNQP